VYVGVKFVDLGVQTPLICRIGSSETSSIQSFTNVYTREVGELTPPPPIIHVYVVKNVFCLTDLLDLE
jgi:hypothetical protein